MDSLSLDVVLDLLDRFIGISHPSHVPVSLLCMFTLYVLFISAAGGQDRAETDLLVTLLQLLLLLQEENDAGSQRGHQQGGHVQPAAL